MALAVLPLPAAAQGSAADAATIAELRRQLEEMRRRLDQLEARSAPPPAARAAVVPARPRPFAPRPAAAPDAEARAAAAEARAAAAEARAAQRDLAAAASTAAGPPGLAPPDPMGRPFATEEALRADLPGVAFRVPGADTQVRLYGFAKLTAHYDLGPRNQTDAPAPQTVPLTGSAADRQGGDFIMGARFSRFGVDTRTLTSWGTLETRLEGDFGGGAATSNNAVFRLRQAWAELGDERLRVLIGQANSLWNEGVFETLIDATNLNQSFVRQAQIRLTGRLTEGLTGQVSIEAPETAYTSAGGVFTPGASLQGGASPAVSSVPDLLGRLTWRQDGIELGLRGMLRQIEIRTDGTAAAAQPVSETAPGWGFAGHARLPMALLWDALGTDEIAAMAFYGEGIGRYFAGQSSGQDALTDLGLPGVVAPGLDTVASYGATVAYRRFWATTLRSTFSYAYARADYPSYALGFAPGSAPALSLNRETQQAIVNLIWSPFAEVRNGVFGSGWLDVGLEYVFTRRDLYGGAAAAGAAGVGHGIANRILFAAIARF
ncbi:DcaP family trimeric outer membrane transporter [Roseomonas sp. HF4]|uniref:DcaP family trimeric outer membrane transporter n=1 Tax=Roseomonas sp. HF4 TaxID=2562313 RepID=UPI00148559D4|nr:DcaP family trimeric outer membrane transporter [Roseomonas sp. HF4]